MTNAKYSNVHCSVCGRVLGRKPGVEVTLNLLCDDLLCEYQGAAPVTAARDAIIITSAIDGDKVSEVAFAHNMSRQRVYQIFDTWKQGI